jgi:hypothetical protein
MPRSFQREVIPAVAEPVSAMADPCYEIGCTAILSTIQRPDAARFRSRPRTSLATRRHGQNAFSGSMGDGRVVG